MGKVLRIGTRPSLLALRQVEEIKNFFPAIAFEVVAIETSGDKDKFTPLAEMENGDFFTREIEQALFNYRIDAAVHSAKDVEESMPQDLEIAALTKSISPYDCLVARGSLTLEKLPAGAVVGTSSKTRKEALKKYRSGLIIKDIRGNIEERLRQLDEGRFDALLVAHAALIRLGWEERIAQIIPEAIIPCHPLQGKLAIQIRKDRQDLKEIFNKINAG